MIAARLTTLFWILAASAGQCQEVTPELRWSPGTTYEYSVESELKYGGIDSFGGYTLSAALSIEIKETARDAVVAVVRCTRVKTRDFMTDPCLSASLTFDSSKKDAKIEKRLLRGDHRADPKQEAETIDKWFGNSADVWTPALTKGIEVKAARQKTSGPATLTSATGHPERIAALILTGVNHALPSVMQPEAAWKRTVDIGQGMVATSVYQSRGRTKVGELDCAGYSWTASNRKGEPKRSYHTPPAVLEKSFIEQSGQLDILPGLKILAALTVEEHLEPAHSVSEIESKLKISLLSLKPSKK